MMNIEKCLKITDNKLGTMMMLSKRWTFLLLIHRSNKYNYYSFYEPIIFNKIQKILLDDSIFDNFLE